tara:strand:- start:1334 stop:1750 length:417 start_codon:yes stop_codon:yes gene_type:complete
VDDNKLKKTAGKIAKWLTYTSLSLLSIVLVWRWCDIGFVIFSLAILGGIFAYLAGLFWDNILYPRNANDGQPSIKVMQTMRVAFTISIISLAGIFDDSTRRSCDNNGPQEAEEVEAIEEDILEVDSNDSSNFRLKEID